MPRSLLHRRPRHDRGFTLIELMIAVVVVAILAAVALPSFMDSIRKSRRSEAFNALSNVQQAQERWRTNNAAYAAELGASGLNIQATTPGGYYTLTLGNVTATTYDAVATAVAGKSQANDGSCAKLGVQMNGGNVRYAANTTAGALAYANTNPCWSR
jgi:type IV pilus assembly protein PilE